MTQSSEFRAQYRARKAALLQPIADCGTVTRGIRAALARLSSLTDRTLCTLWQEAGLASPLALLAVGGYGRAELFPGSDVDVLLLLPNEQPALHDELLKASIETFIGSCWDTGLEIGSSVRTVDECLQEAARDVTV